MSIGKFAHRDNMGNDIMGEKTRGIMMQEIKIKNKAELNVYINGMFEIKNIPQDILECLINFYFNILKERSAFISFPIG